MTEPTKPASSAGAVRMALSRERRRLGFRCIWLDVHDDNVAALVRRGLLSSTERDDQAIADALGRFLDATL